jgi:hypothetical protein
MKITPNQLPYVRVPCKKPTMLQGRFRLCSPEIISEFGLYDHIHPWVMMPRAEESLRYHYDIYKTSESQVLSWNYNQVFVMKLSKDAGMISNGKVPPIKQQQ